MSDPRFARLKHDPRFRRPKKNSSKVVVDQRFQSVFAKSKDRKKTDKYGRALSSTHDTDNLRRFYKLEDEEEAAPDYARGGVLMESSDEESDEESDNGGTITFHQQDHPSDQEIDLDETNFEDLDAQAATYTQTHADSEHEQESVVKTARLAVVNLDWDHVRASHLYKVFSSLVTPTAPLVASTSRDSKKSNSVARGRVLNVRVYPSQFGKDRMAREEKEGPPPEVFKKHREEEINETTIYEVGEGDDYDEDALRRYQLERLRYYYAIVTCDTVDAASHIFDELEGTEFERSANVFDLSFVPDGMTFDDEPRDEATEDAGANYKGLEFVTDALRHSKVKLTWDEDDPERNQLTRRKLTRKEIESADFKAYIASSSGSESEEEGGKKDKSTLRALLLGGDNDQLPEGWGTSAQDNDDDVDMEVTFAPGLSDAKDDHEETTLDKYQRKMREKRQKQKEEQKNKPDKGDDFFVAESGSDEEDEEPSKSTFKRSKERKEVSRPSTSEAELSLLAASNDPEGDAKHFDFKAVIKAEKGKKRKGKGKQKRVAVDQDEVQEDFSINVNDVRFAAIHDNHSFAIDPSHPQFKKTKSMSALLSERVKRQRDRSGEEVGTLRKGGDASTSEKSLHSLVESVKRKSNVAHMGRGKRSKQ